MGLRIIGRTVSQPPREVTDAERLDGLAAETRRWAEVKGLTNLDFQTKFIDNFRRAKARIASPSGEQAAQMAARLRDSILGCSDGAQSHGQVEVATLIALL